MKKSLLTLAAAVALVGCSQEDLLTGQQNGNVKGAVGANIFVPTNTRGAALNKVDDLIASNNGFDLISYYNDNEWTHFMGQASDGIEFMYDEGVWDYADRGEMTFWQDVPETATDLKFFAVSPTKDKLPENSSYTIGAETSHITYQVPETVSEQVDLMFAQTDVADGEYESTSAIYNNGVPLYFHHALSQIVFQARIDEKDASEEDPTVSSTVTAYVNSITLKNVYGSGEFDMDGASAILDNKRYEDPTLNEEAEYTNLLWSTTGDKTASYEITSLMNNTGIKSIEPLTLTDGEVTGEYKTALLLIPQPLTALSLEDIDGNVSSVNDEQFWTLSEDARKGSYLEVSCRVEFNNSAIVGSKEAAEGDDNYYDKLYIPINTNWNPGYKYVYTLVFGAESGDPVKAYVETVDQWNTPNGEDDENGDDNGDDTPQESTLAFGVQLYDSHSRKGTVDYLTLESNLPDVPTVSYSLNGQDWYDNATDAQMGWVTVTQETEYSLRRSVAKKNTVAKTRSADSYQFWFNFQIDEIPTTTSTGTYQSALQANAVKGAEGMPVDLSTHDVYGESNSQNTANCYVVNSAGWYMFPLVYGNAITNGEENQSAFSNAAAQSLYIYSYSTMEATSPELLWSSVEGLVSEVALSDDYVTFKVAEGTINEGNAVIAVKDNNNNIVWSWHIWVTPVDLRPVVTNNSTNASAMPVNLGWVSDGNTQTTIYSQTPRSGWVRFTQGEKSVEVQVNQRGYYCAEGAVGGSQPYYQWGRKDPFVSGKYTSEGSGSLEGSIQNPAVFYTSTESDMTVGKWFSNLTTNANMWNSSVTANNTTGTDETTKTIFDPCPAGFAVAPSTAFSDFNNGSYTWNNGYAIEVGGRSIYFPVSDRLNPNDGTIEEKGEGYCLASVLTNSYPFAGGFNYGEDKVDAAPNLSTGAGYPVRPVLVPEPSDDYEEEDYE